MPDTDVLISYELIGVIVSIIGGFGVLSYQIGRRSKDIDVLAEAVEANTNELNAHNDDCKVERQQAAGYRTRTDERLAEGSKHMAVLDERTKSMQEDIREIKDAVKP